MISDAERTLILRFARLKISSDAEATNLREVHAELLENHQHIMTRHIDAYGLLQLHFPGHCFCLADESEVLALGEAIAYEIRIWERVPC